MLISLILLPGHLSRGFLKKGMGGEPKAKLHLFIGKTSVSKTLKSKIKCYIKP